MSKRILLVSTSFPSIHDSTSGIGGAPFLLNEVRALVTTGNRIQVIMPQKRGLKELESEYGICVKRVSYPLMSCNPGYNLGPQHGKITLLVILSQILMSLALLWAIFWELMTRHYDLIWSNWLQVGFIAFLANWKGVPHMVTIRGSDVRESSPKFVRLMAKATPNILNMYTEDPELRIWISRYNFRSWGVPSVYAPRFIERRDEKNIITIIGRLDGEQSSFKLKGLGYPVAEVIAELMARRLDVLVVVIGDGKERHSYEEILKAYAERVTFTGWLTEFDSYLSRASIVIGGGGLNGVIMDTVPNEVPILISKYLKGGLWKDHINCLVYDPEDKKSWLKVLEYAIDNKALLQKLAVNAKRDLEKFAKPVNLAGKSWDVTLSQFCSAKY